ncbi:MAG: SigE family RNA polymerase sigma factor [Actinomycetota bacterium]|nr:SigE family RNA polymerase sigma factor [Actinomycetota bacterium]
MAVTGATDAAELAMTQRKESVADLYQRHAADAVQLAYLLSGDKHLAEDLAQDAFVRLFGRFQELRKPEAFPFYLRRTIVNLSRDHFRRLQRERALSRRHHSSELEDDYRPDQVEVRDGLLEALQRLPPRQRAAVVLRYCEGLSEHESAEILQTSVGAVNSLVSRGLGSLREGMKDEDR